MDFCTYGHMIDNVVLIVTGTLHERDVQVSAPCLCLRRDSAVGRDIGMSATVHSNVSCHCLSHDIQVSIPQNTHALQELLDKCHPLGVFDSIATLAVAQNMRELYRLVLVDTPLAPYFSEHLTQEDLDEMNIEVWLGCGRCWDWQLCIYPLPLALLPANFRGPG